jgi:GT2 family glycosyltransferase
LNSKGRLLRGGHIGRIDVTIAIAVHKSEKYISACIRSLLAQTIKGFEILIVEDPPFDRTKRIIDTIEDQRIRYFGNQKKLGISRSRNECVRRARGKYIFFTDGDCVVSDDWVEAGLKCFLRPECIGVEGKTYYVSERYEPTYSDRVIENLYGGKFMTCNIAYKRDTIEEIGGFDERYTYFEDRDIALRAMKRGKICFNSKMLVYHRKNTLTPMQFVKQAWRTGNRVLLYKKFGERAFLTWRIVCPLNLMATIFPPLTLGSLFRNKYKSKEDFRLIPFNYLRLVYERLGIWNMCAKERVFLI